jgi:hypothetical protein
MNIVVKTRQNALIATIRRVMSCDVNETLAGEKTLSFQTLLEGGLENVQDGGQYIVEFEGDTYDVTSIKKALSSGMYTIQFSCEHISYRLTDIPVEQFSSSGTPSEIMTAILNGSGFIKGTVISTGQETYSLQQSGTVRGVLMDYAATYGYDLEFYNRYVSLLTHRGSTVAKTILDRNVVSIGKTINLADGTHSYDITIRPSEDVTLGDEARLVFTKLGINEDVRIVGIKRSPYTTKNITLQVGAYEPSVESQTAAVATDMVAKGKNYHGVKITSEKGLEITRTDKTAKVVLNSDEFRMQAADSEGNLKDKLYFDPITGEYKFVGTVSIDGGDINIGGNFRVDQYGNAYLAGDATIYGGKYYAGTPLSQYGFSQMTPTGFEVFNSQNDIKLRLGYTTNGEDFPFMQLGSGSGASTDYGLIKKFTDGLWIGNSEPADDNGNFEAKTGYNGIFFKFEDNMAYVVKDTAMKNIYTGAAIARFA